MPTDAKFAVLVMTAPPPGVGGGTDGAYVKVDGRECVLRSVELFLNRDGVVQTLMAVTAEDGAKVRDRYGPHLSFSGVKLVTGGPRWADQMAAAAPLLSAEATHVIVHDAARPVVSGVDVDALMAAAGDHAAVALAAPVRTVLVEVDDGGDAVAVHRPSSYRQLLSPSAYGRVTFEELARSKAELHPSKLTLVAGSPLNVRVAGAGDASLAKAMLGLLPKPKLKANSNPFEEAQW